MTPLIKQLLTCLLSVWLTASTVRAAESETLFNRKDLSGWKGLDGFWSVQDGAIVGETTAEKKIQKNTFLVWQGGNVTDFEFTATVRFKGNNSGVQYRSQFIDEPMLALKGYQLDLHPTPKLFGMLYGEKYDGRGMIATRGDDNIDGEGSLRAITISHINRTINEETGFSLTDNLAGNLPYRAKIFADTMTPFLLETLEEGKK